MKKYREDNKLKITKQVKEYYEKHKDEISEQQKKYRKSDGSKAKRQLYAKEYYQNNREEAIRKSKEYDVANKQEKKAYSRTRWGGWWFRYIALSDRHPLSGSTLHLHTQETSFTSGWCHELILTNYLMRGLKAVMKKTCVRQLIG